MCADQGNGSRNNQQHHCLIEQIVLPMFHHRWYMPTYKRDSGTLEIILPAGPYDRRRDGIPLPWTIRFHEAAASGSVVASLNVGLIPSSLKREAEADLPHREQTHFARVFGDYLAMIRTEINLTNSMTPEKRLFEALEMPVVAAYETYIALRGFLP